MTKYYLAFLRRFPSIDVLANAKLAQVMKIWEGMEYYTRARNIHRAAIQIQNRFGGRIPDTLEDLTSLPGIGRTTAGAILSIAFNQRFPVLDGNVIRVLSRVFHITEDVSRSSTRKKLWSVSGNILPQEDVNIFNQALMELGATLCRPRNPSCISCPLSNLCEARKRSNQAKLPVKSPRKNIPHYDVTAGIIWKNGRFLITLRPARGLLGGLWEFPGGKKEGHESLEDCLQREIREELEIDIRIDDILISVKHAYSHFRITLHAFRCSYLKGTIHPVECEDFRWITVNDLDSYAFPAADRKIIQVLKNQSGGMR
jgi:A/G-specific adenine glycosylase